MDHTILLFLRIGEPKYILELYRTGTVFMNPLKNFRKIENDFRGDAREGALNYTNPKDATIRFSFLDYEIKPTHIQYGEVLSTGNLYCLYCISSYGFPNPDDFYFDPKNLEFGSQCLIIKKPGVFIEKVEQELRTLGYNFNHGFVEYYQNKQQLRDLTPFHKRQAYEHQKEFRFFVENDRDEPIKLDIGSMESYSEIVDARELSTLKLSRKV